jgi:hypothetical protein
MLASVSLNTQRCKPQDVPEKVQPNFGKVIGAMVQTRLPERLD